MPALDTIRRLGATKYLGPSPTFSELHLLKALYVLGERGAIGRGLLARSLGLGHGAVRTLIERLRRNGLITVAREGCTLTARGRRTLEGLRHTLSPPTPVKAGRLATGKESAAVLVRGVAPKVRIGIEQRDAAIRAGASGAATLVYRAARFEVPGSGGDPQTEFPDPVWRRLVEVFRPRDGDVIIISSAASREVAENGVLNAATTLL